MPHHPPADIPVLLRTKRREAAEAAFGHPIQLFYVFQQGKSAIGQHSLPGINGERIHHMEAIRTALGQEPASVAGGMADVKGLVAQRRFADGRILREIARETASGEVRILDKGLQGKLKDDGQDGNHVCL